VRALWGAVPSNRPIQGPTGLLEAVESSLRRVVTEAATKYASWGQKLFSDLAALDPDGAARRCATQEAPYVAAPQGLLSQPAFGCAVASAEFPRRVCELAPGP
jgi:hypothetical protein